MAKTTQIPFDMDDPYEAKVGAMLDMLKKGHMKLWVLKQCRRVLGDEDVETMAQRLKDDLIGNLEDGHKRDQAAQAPVQHPRTDKPLQAPKTSEPLQRPPDEGEPLRKAAPDEPKSSLFL